MKKLTLAALALSLSAVFGTSLACTTIITDKGATADGSFLVARSADSNALKAQHVVIHPATKNQKGMYRTADHNGANHFEYPLPENGMRYTTVPNWKTQLHGATGFNEAGVGISGTESIFARDDALKIDPYVEDTGITEDDIPDVILPRVKTARDGVALLGKIVEEKGAGEGFGVVFVDDKELWYFETGTGHQWLARQVPKDQYFASGNQGRLQQYKANDPAFMASPTLVEFATKHGFYDPAKDGEFNFSKAYTRDDDRDRDYNDPRVWEIQRLLSPSVKQFMTEGRQFPVFMTPEKKLAVDDMKALLRNHFDGQWFDPYSNGLKTDTPRPISVFRTYESHVMQVRPELPRAIGEVTYLAMGMSALSCYVPFYHGLSKIPAEYGQGTDKADDTSAYWKYRKLQTLVITDFPNLAPIVTSAYRAWEAEAAKKMAAFEKDYVELVKKDPKAAQTKLDEFNTALIRDAESLTERLTNEVFTARTASVQKANFFANRQKKD